ncbi:MAG: hypothetical protein EPO32_13815 [Anaerolineae bacterium]|nr:MAG: hypothetical protein EPO32_13815 [Anaerolineae bacterium]
MDAATKQELQRAYAYLKSGDRKSASQVVVGLLKREPDVEQAWLILSLSVDDRARQVYALQQVLRLNPGNDKARERLTKLGGSALPASPSTAARPTASKPEPVTNYGDDAPFESAGDSDLLSSRLFGEEAKPAISTPASAAPTWGGFSDDAPDDEAPFDQPFAAEPTKEPTKPRGRRERRERKPGALRRILISILLLLLLIVVLGGGYMGWQSGLFGGTGSGGAGDDEPTSEPSATATDSAFLLPATWTPTVFVAPSATPSITPMPTASPTPLADLLSGEAQTSADTIEDQVAAIRGISNDPAVGRAMVSQGAMEQILAAETQGDDFWRRSGDISVVYGAFGLVTPGTNLQTYYQNTQILPWGGMYLTDGPSLYVLGINFESRQAYGYAHLYDLALLDSEFDLESLGLLPDCLLARDECIALNALVQGDATLARQQWAERYLTAVQAADLGVLDEQVSFFQDFTNSAFTESDQRFPYVQGLAFVQSLFDEGGWAAVNEAYSNPPVSSEHILHPETYLAGDLPIEVVDPLVGENFPSGWRLMEQGTLGEWRTHLLLAYNKLGEFPIEPADAAAAAAGWGGDGYQVYYEDATRNTAVMVHWIFDTADDAEEFDAALALHLSGRYLGDADSSLQGVCYGSGPVACTLFIDNEVFWLGAPNADLMRLMLEGLGFGG